MHLGIVLSSGGPLGISHLGALKRLEEEKIKPDIISGSSAGSIVGGLYATDMSLNEMIDLALGTDISHMFSDYTIFGMYSNGFGAIKGNNMLKILREKTANKNFNDLKIPFAANAVNFLTSKEIILKKGNIAEAMRASSSIPMLFKPYYLNGKYLIDGSVSNPLPVNAAKKLGADHTIGISFKRRISKISKNKDPMYTFKQILLSRFSGPLFQKFRYFLESKLFDKILRYFALDRKMIYHFHKMHDASVTNIGAKQSDFLINTDLSDTMYSKEEIIRKAYEATDKIIDDINISIENKKRALTKIRRK